MCSNMQQPRLKRAGSHEHMKRASPWTHIIQGGPGERGRVARATNCYFKLPVRFNTLLVGKLQRTCMTQFRGWLTGVIASVAVWLLFEFSKHGQTGTPPPLKHG